MSEKTQETVPEKLRRIAREIREDNYTGWGNELCEIADGLSHLSDAQKQEWEAAIPTPAMLEAGAMEIAMNQQRVMSAERKAEHVWNAMVKAATPSASAEAVPSDFVEWLKREMPSGTVIGDPTWWAPKILRALRAALQSPTPAQDGPLDEMAVYRQACDVRDWANTLGTVLENKGALIASIDKLRAMVITPDGSEYLGRYATGEDVQVTTTTTPPTKQGQAEPCRVSIYRSCVCSRGTKGCNIDHPKADSSEPRAYNRARQMADEVMTCLESIGTGWNEDDIDEVQSKLLPNVYDCLNLLAMAADNRMTERERFNTAYDSVCNKAITDREIAWSVWQVATAQPQADAGVSELPPIERDEAMDRTYIPIPGGWEIQTQGKGSTFRICNTKTGDRWPVVDSHLHKPLEQMARELKPCPFCGMRPPEDLIDTLYPNGIWWRQHEWGRSYHGHRDRRPTDEQCMSMHCTENMGGCGAEITADSEEEVRAKWNRRVPATPIEGREG